MNVIDHITSPECCVGDNINVALALVDNTTERSELNDVRSSFQRLVHPQQLLLCNSRQWQLRSLPTVRSSRNCQQRKLQHIDNEYVLYIVQPRKDGIIVVFGKECKARTSFIYLVFLLLHSLGKNNEFS